jgi:hypothetical protein
LRRQSQRFQKPFGKWLIALAKTDVLLLEEWGMAGMDSQTRAELMENIDEGCQ